MKKTPLHAEHLKLNAKMVEFAGFEMPIQYKGIVEEHMAVRQKAGLFDVSHMGEFECTGPDALSFLQYVTTNDVNKLTDGMAQYSLLCNEKGGVVDDIIVYRLHKDSFVIVVNAANIEKDFAWLTKQKKHFPDVELNNVSEELSLLALQGPKAIPIIKTLTDFDVEGLQSFHFAKGTVAGQTEVAVARTGYTGEDGVEICCRNAQAVPIWQALMAKGVEPIGLGARDTLRLEARLSLYGQEITDETNPLEAGLGFVVKLDKGDFIGRATIQKVKEQGLRRKIVGFQMLEKAIPRHDYKIILENGEEGIVTTGSYSPILEKGIGLGYVPAAFSAIGTKFNIDIRGRQKLAEVVKTPFIKKG